MKRFFESLKPDLELAQENNCTLAIENHSGRALLNKIDSIRPSSISIGAIIWGLPWHRTIFSSIENRWKRQFACAVPS